MNATYETIAERPTLRFERLIPHPIEAVWQAITEPAELAHWFPSKVELDLRLGGRMMFTFEEMPLEDAPLELSGEITDLDPPHLFAFEWGGDHLIFELEEAEPGAACRLRFTVALDSRDKAARDAAGWHVCLDRLERRLASTSGMEPGEETTEEWRALYEDYGRRGFPTGAPIPGE